MCDQGKTMVINWNQTKPCETKLNWTPPNEHVQNQAQPIEIKWEHEKAIGTNRFQVTWSETKLDQSEVERNQPNQVKLTES